MDAQQEKRSKRRRRALVAAPVLCVLVAVAAVLLWPAEPRTEPQRKIVAASPSPPPPLAYEAPEPKPKPKPKPKPRPKPKPKPKPTEIRVDENAARPTAVAVRSAGIEAPMIALGLKPNGKIEVPEDIADAGWRQGGPEPGERGAAMITAHVNGGGRPGAFSDLDSVSRGDEIDVRRADGTTVTFVAESTEQVAKTNFPTDRVYADTRQPTLRLVTCGGAFNDASGHYRDNLIVYATRKAT